MRRGVRLPLNELRPYLFSLRQPVQRLELAELFGNNHPVELEVGFGKGAFLIAAAQLHPERNYLGIETERGLQLYVANRVAKRYLANVKLAHGDAGTLLADYLPPASLQTIHVYFPDPWWKKRHRKRRVFSTAFVLNCAKSLRTGGELAIATDVAEYFQIIFGMVSEQPEFEAVQVNRIEAADAGLTLQTNFGKKALEQGRPVWRGTFRRL